MPQLCLATRTDVIDSLVVPDGDDHITATDNRYEKEMTTPLGLAPLSWT